MKNFQFEFVETFFLTSIVACFIVFSIEELVPVAQAEQTAQINEVDSPAQGNQAGSTAQINEVDSPAQGKQAGPTVQEKEADPVVQLENKYPQDTFRIRESIGQQFTEINEQFYSGQPANKNSKFFLTPGSPIQKSDVFQKSLEATPNKCLPHLASEIQKLKEGDYKGDGDWLAHVANCKECCGPLMASVWEDYYTRVGKLPHVTVFFDHDSAKIKGFYVNQLKDFYDQHLKDGGRAFLVGRASIGDPDSDRYNLVLSGKRAVSVKNFLKELGANQSQLEYRYFGWRPPQLDRNIAKVYRIPDVQFVQVFTPYIDKKDKRKLNQSVVVVGY